MREIRQSGSVRGVRRKPYPYRDLLDAHSTSSLLLRKTMKRLAILGSTGSIGQSTLSIVEQFPDRYSVVALAAGRNIDEAFAQTLRWRPKIVSLATEELAGQLVRQAQASRRHRH